jgi:penicillin amidase
VHLNAPGWDVIGATEPSIPGVAIGHNGRIGWGLTIVGTDYDDVFVEEINPDNSKQARWQGKWYGLRIETDTIQVRGQAPRTIERKYSRHGPIFYEDTVNHRAYAVRSTLQERGTAEYLGALRLNQASLASTCRDFVELQRYYLAPSENMICGDVDGNIAWHASALTPRRSGGWYGRLPVPGTGHYKWDGFRDDLPFEYNPERGWIATANHNILPHGYYPPLFFKRAPYPRWDRLNQIFSSPRDLRAEDFERFQHDSYWPYIDAEKALLRGWTSPDADIEWARRQIVEWNGHYERESIAASVHSYWRRNLDPDVLRPDGTKRAEDARMALEQGVSELRKRLGADRNEWRWGRLHKSEFPHRLVKAFDLPGVERSGGGGTMAATGATFREIIDLSDLDNSRATSTPGQSGQPGSPFYDNLRELWGSQRYFPLRYSRKEVNAAAAYRLTLRPRS